jgi:hypothetical protein
MVNSQAYDMMIFKVMRKDQWYTHMHVIWSSNRKSIRQKGQLHTHIMWIDIIKRCKNMRDPNDPPIENSPSLVQVTSEDQSKKDPWMEISLYDPTKRNWIIRFICANSEPEWDHVIQKQEQKDSWSGYCWIVHFCLQTLAINSPQGN